MLCRQAVLLSSWSNKPPPITQEFYVLSVPFFITIYFFYFPNYFYKLLHQETKRSSVSCRWRYKHHYKFIVESICNCRKFISCLLSGWKSPFTFYFLCRSSVFRFKSLGHLFMYHHDNISCLALWYFWFFFKPTF